MNSIRQQWDRCSPATRLALVAALLAGLNPWLGGLVALVAAWHQTRTSPLLFGEHLPLWYALPVVMALVTLARGESLPTDDLLRHLSAWQLGFDYRAQYPWSNLPPISLWLGFDYLLGVLQQAGIPKTVLLQWLPAFGVTLQAAVLYGALRQAVPAHRQRAELFLMLAALGLLLTTPRMLLGRPEAFLLALGSAAALCNTRTKGAVWLAGFLAAVPFYWLGWVYAPFALLLRGWRLRVRFTLASCLVLAHIAFWQAYSGDYFGLLWWLRGTLSVPATENAPMAHNLGVWMSWLLIALASWGLSLRLRKSHWRNTVPFVLLLVWFALPNQVRYQPALALALLPWLYRTACQVAAREHFRMPSVPVLCALAMAGLFSVGASDPPPKFALGPNARVYSEQPYATVFYGAPGIAVEPSFALGATKPQWRGIFAAGKVDCERLNEGGFTHLVENSLVEMPGCATLAGVDGPWRLWELR